jgi:hypothetical protein
MQTGFQFDPTAYGPEVARILDLDGGGFRPMRLAPTQPTSTAALAELKKWKAGDLFSNSRVPDGAMAGLYTYFSAFDAAHGIAQDLETVDGSFWHGILHRQEPDAFNASYWFRRVRSHAVFAPLNREAAKLGYATGRDWDALQFIEFCEAARRRPGSAEEELAMRVQLVEWQLLFNYCAEAVTV